MAAPSFDIFCRVVDNFGDIGVCWRLARQIAAMPERCPVRLWVDHLPSFAKIESRVNDTVSTQHIAGVAIIHWTEHAPDLLPHSAVIAAFGCDPHARFLARMAEQKSLWVNLEYLSAESWVESCHALPSLQSSGIRKTFFFPGFTQATGGLLRERNLLADRDSWLSAPERHTALLRELGLPADKISTLKNGGRQVMLFCYPDAPVDGLVKALNAQDGPSILLVPAGVSPGLKRGQIGRTYVHQIPFVDQAVFDHLLWSSDLNCVRGEDSLVRAIWAGKPMLWQIYRQEDEAHLVKLRAWLDISPHTAKVHGLMLDWNTASANAFESKLDDLLRPAAWQEWQAASRMWSHSLAEQTSLARSLVDFCTQ